MLSHFLREEFIQFWLSLS